MSDLQTALRAVPLLEHLPLATIEWLTTQGSEIRLQPGDIHRAEGSPADCVFVLLEGEVRVFQKVGEQELVLAVYLAKTLYGEIPILMGDDTFWASGRAVTDCWIFELQKDAFWRLIATCMSITTSIFRTMAQRVQGVQSMLQEREKLAALGTLAAGLAHEMNNPAAAVSRSARSLQTIWQELPSLALQLNQQSLTDDQLAFLVKLQREVIKVSPSLGADARAPTLPSLNPLEQSDREDKIADWLNAHQIANSWELASTFVAAGLDADWLDGVADRLPSSALPQVLTWLTETLAGLGLINQIEQGTARLSNLVKAIKDYSYLDQAPLQEVDIREGLESTLTMLGYKLKRGVTVTRHYADLPRISAYGSELNQVWTSLIDNAIDAVLVRPTAVPSATPSIQLSTWREHDHVLVEISDNGLGIPPELRSRIFEPFFTTKGVGEGSGLGLDAARRIVIQRHHGDIRFDSSPNGTSFQVRLPIEIPKHD